MTVFEIHNDRLIYSMDRRNAPALRVPSGSTVVFHTRDCFEDQIQQPEDYTGLNWERINPATGPVFIEGARPGDTLVLQILNIEIGDQAVMVTGPGLGVEGDALEQSSVSLFPVRDGHISLGRVTLPVQPMIGVIGTAPAGDPVPNGTPDDHGGNMDSTVICTGHTLFLPVNVEGGLLALGDLHAAMGDGEVSVCGLEVPGKVTLKINVLPHSRWPLPIVQTPAHLYTIASAVTLDEAAQRATKHMSTFLQQEAGLSRAEAIGLMSAAGHLQISQVVDPQKTCRFEMSFAVLSQLGIEPLWRPV